jgi:hypothetical protein
VPRWRLICWRVCAAKYTDTMVDISRDGGSDQIQKNPQGADIAAACEL